MLEGKARRNAAAALVAVLIAGGLCLLILDAAGAKQASAPPAHAASIKTIDISVTSDGSDAGYYVWEDQLLKDSTDPTYYDLVVRSGSARIFWTWPAGGGSSHNVKMKTGINYATNKPYSTPGLSFFNGKGSGSPFTNNSGSDFNWPTKQHGGVNGWVPSKAGSYYLFCSQHSAMFMKVIVKGFATKLAAETKRGIVKSGSKAMYAKVTAAAPVKATVKVVQCKNSSCSKGSAAYAKAVNLRKGTNRLKLGFKSGLAVGRYQVQVITPAETLRSAFAVKR